VNKDNKKPKWVFLLKHLTLVFTTLHLYSDISHERNVRLSVKRVNCDKTK